MNGGPVPSVSLGVIDVDRLRLMVQRSVWRDGVDHSRWIFRSAPDADEQLVYKIWNPGYIRRDNILDGIGAGLYTEQTTPGLRALIMHKGLCRGYVMGVGQRLRAPSPSLVHALWQATRRSGLFACQYRQSHTMLVDGRPSLIDLEGVYPVSEHRADTINTSRIENPCYARLVIELNLNNLSPEDVERLADRHLARWREGTSENSWIRRKGNGAWLRLRRLSRRYFPDSRDLIER